MLTTLTLLAQGWPSRQQRNEKSNEKRKNKRQRRSRSNSTKKNAQELFRKQYAEEFEEYLSLNAKQPFVARVKQFPFRHVIILALFLFSVRKVKEWVKEELEYNREKTQTSALVLLSVVGGMFFADFITGLIHLLADINPLSPYLVTEKPLNQWISWGFHLHHAWVENWNHCDIYYAGFLRAGFLFYLPVMSMVVLFHHSLNRFVGISLIVAAHTGIFVQYSHAAAHGRWKGNKLVKLLQRLHLILPKETHQLHHRDFDKNFAILNGWSGFVLNLLYKAIRACGGIDERVSPEIQKKVYIANKSRMKPPYLAIYPEFRKDLSL